MEGNGLVRSRISRLSIEKQNQINEALKCSDTFKSGGKDAAAWFILGLVCCVGGGIACLYETDWKEALSLLRSGYYDPFFGDLITVPALALCVIAAAVLIRFWVLFRGRYGQILLPDAIGKIRGGRVVLAPFGSISEIQSSSFEMELRDSGIYRNVYTTEIIMKDGSKLKLYNCGGMKLAQLFERFGKKKP